MKKFSALIIALAIIITSSFSINVFANVETSTDAEPQSNKTEALFDKIDASKEISVSLVENANIFPASYIFKIKDNNAMVGLDYGFFSLNEYSVGTTKTLYSPSHPFYYIRYTEPNLSIFPPTASIMPYLIQNLTDIPLHYSFSDPKTYSEKLDGIEYIVEEFCYDNFHNYKFYYIENELKILDYRYSHDSSLDCTYYVTIDFDSVIIDDTLPKTAFINITLFAKLFLGI